MRIRHFLFLWKRAFQALHLSLPVFQKKSGSELMGKILFVVGQVLSSKLILGTFTTQKTDSWEWQFYSTLGLGKWGRDHMLHRKAVPVFLGSHRCWVFLGQWVENFYNAFCSPTERFVPPFLRLAGPRDVLQPY